MKILAIHSIFGEDESKKPAVDMWRIYRPLRELRKHVDWQIDEQPTLIKGLEKYKSYKEFTQEEMEKAFENVCKYDIVFSSYAPNTSAYTLLKVACDKAGVQYVLDVDDDMFAVNPDNPVWTKINDEHCYFMQCMIRDNNWISTTTEELAEVFRKRRTYPEDSVLVVPNYIPDDYQHPEFDNGDKIVIGFFGGSSHYAELHETGFAEAIKRLMIENKNVYFKTVGVPFDKYVPRARYEFVEGKRGKHWVEDIYPNLNIDISVAPLHHDIFNRGKSNIKWQESTRAGAAFVASNYGPYKHIPKNCAITVDNTSEAWYQALKKLVDSKAARQSMVAKAQAELEKNWRLEDNWQKYKQIFETVAASKVK